MEKLHASQRQQDGRREPISVAGTFGTPFLYQRLSPPMLVHPEKMRLGGGRKHMVWNVGSCTRSRILTGC